MSAGQGQQGRALYSEKHKSSFCKVSSSDLRVFVFSFIPLHHNSLCKVGVVTSAFTGTGEMFPGICRTLLLRIYKRQKENHKEMKSLAFRAGSEQLRHPLLGSLSVEFPAQPAQRGAGLVAQTLSPSLNPRVRMCQHREATQSFSGQK